VGCVFRARFGLAALIFVTVPAATRLPAQSQASAPAPAAPQMSRDELTAFAKVHLAIAMAHDSIDAQLALPRNKTAQAQKQLQDKLRTQIEEILHHSGMSEGEYQRKTYLVSTDADARKTFDGIIAQITGVPTPGQVLATANPGAVPAADLPPGGAGIHIGHVVNAFGDTPDGMGLLPTAVAEVRIATQHATLAGRAATLDGMKLHAGHVINALDPTIITTGPGRGYGAKRAALGVATHIELAAKADGAPPNVTMHAVHIAMSARNTAQRADQIIALAKQVQAATTMPEAQGLLSQMVSLCEQLTAGADANGDGKISWEQGEGGLQQVQEHITLMLKKTS
jgi:hypothetical protein